jgi:O-antigen ligase
MYVTSLFKNEKGKIEPHLVLFFLNVFLVVLGYSLRGSSFQVVKLLRVVLVVISLVRLSTNPGTYHYVFPGQQSWRLWVFIFLNLYVLAFSFDFMQSLNRIAAWLPFLIYINYFIINLFRKYDIRTAQVKILQMFHLCYIYPMLIVAIAGNPFQNKDIYGTDISGFKSNVIGWAGAMVFITTLDVLANLQLSRTMRRIFIGLVFLSLIITASSGSRSSYISIAMTLLILVFQNQRLKFSSKFLISLLIVGGSFYVLQDENSAINKRIQKSEQQLKTGEARKELLEAAIEVMEDHPLLLITGLGYDMSVEGIRAYKPIDNKLRLHNSYLEVLVSTGGFTFLFFMIFYVLNAIYSYVRYDMRTFVFLPTLIFIPAFESNLNAGQFLFFPWMTFLFFYIHYRSPQRLIVVPSEPTLQTTEAFHA